MFYRLLVLLHLIGVVAFFSNAVAALFWRARAERSRDAAWLAHTFRTLVAGDLLLTPLSSAAVVASGLVLAAMTGLPIFGTGWILLSIVAFTGSGVVFAGWVLPRQRRLADWLEEAAMAGALDWGRYLAEARRWSRPAHLSLLLALAALVLMVLRPQL